ncbi:MULTISPECIES: cytochrome P450 family protein [Nonomuraea]|uniref:Cytochrome P450 n=1 Tax=Nonomuraea ferruginea TaxID=46174 RepID=A0ABT4SVR5_9ACTN|nr:cytochrome P450 [Nonomuraea ferruginea]MDA0640985.1 cytochrome P450 [Nonomuraea ferruginea]
MDATTDADTGADTGAGVEFVLDPATLDVHADCERLRELGPLVRVEMEGVRAWAATRHATLAAVLAHPDLSRDIAYWDPEGRAAVRDGTAVRRITFDTSMLNAEGEEHRRLRGPMARVFNARRVEELRPWVARLAAERVDHLATLPPGPVDLREQFAYPIPRDVITELMGIPPAMRARVHELTDVAAGVGDTPVDVTEARKVLYGMVAEIIEGLRRTPGPGLISALVQEGELTGKELLDTVELVFIAGHVTTVNLLTNGARALLREPAQLALALGGELAWSAVVEETMRWDSPIAHFPMRYAVRDLEIEGVRVRKGEAVVACFASAGRDPERYGARACRFDAVAEQPGHLSFGHGRHFCLGAPLARLEGEVALAALFEAFPDMRLAGPDAGTRPLGSVLGNSTRSLPVLLGERHN